MTFKLAVCETHFTLFVTLRTTVVVWTVYNVSRAILRATLSHPVRLGHAAHQLQGQLLRLKANDTYPQIWTFRIVNYVSLFFVKRY